MKTKKSIRPTELTLPLIARICAKVRHGVSLEAAAITCGVNRPTLHLWLRTGEEAIARTQPDANPAAAALVTGHTSHVTLQESLCVELVEATDQATAEADVRDMAVIAEAAKTDWRAAAWILDHWDEMARQSALRGMPAVGPAREGPLLESKLTSELRHQTSRLVKRNVRLWGRN